MEKHKQLRQQTVSIDGKTFTKAVRDVSLHRGYLQDRELGFVQHKGMLYMVERVDAYLADNPHRAPWNVVEGQETIQLKARKESFLNASEKAWLDAAVEWMLQNEYKPLEQHHYDWDGNVTSTYFVLPGVTPTRLARNLFDNYASWAIEREVGEIPEKIRPAWDNFEIYQKMWVSQVTSALKRLKTAGKAFSMIGESNGREARMYAHKEYE